MSETLHEQVPSSLELRAMLEEMVVKDLRGPSTPDEEIDEPSVRDRYLVGMLAPRRVMSDEGRGASEEEVSPLATSNSPLEDEELVEGGDFPPDDPLAIGGVDSIDEGATELTPPQPKAIFPSSFGMTFSVALETTEIQVTSNWGQYLREPSETITTQKGTPKRVWKRYQRGGTPHTIPVQHGSIISFDADQLCPDVRIEGIMRRRGDHWSVTVFLVNHQPEPDKLRDQMWLFQPELIVDAADGSAIFDKKPSRMDLANTDPTLKAENDMLNMLYRRTVEFSVGHGVGVHVDVASDDPSRAVRISTRVIPNYEVPKTDFPEADDAELNPAFRHLDGVVRDMYELSETPASQLRSKLEPLVTAYEEWIDLEAAKIGNPDEGLAEYRHVAEMAIDHCRRTLERIRQGIDLLDPSSEHHEPLALKAFLFMNRAMWLQRTHSIFSEKVRRGEEEPDFEGQINVPHNRSWRPFQLAFVLLNLPGITRFDHPERGAEADAVADLLWFPTGGGKTEAYLGLTAYTLGLRRLQGSVEGRDGEHGVAVLMRYTLRLLTLQQFQRATALICACEDIRRDALTQGDNRWGLTPFRIGLWVGNRATPNKTSQSDESVKSSHGGKPKSGAFGGGGSPHQLTNCPWCGSKIDPGKNITVEKYNQGRGRTLIYCGNRYGQCKFSKREAPKEGLPVLVVDEEIYRNLPSLLPNYEVDDNNDGIDADLKTPEWQVFSNPHSVQRTRDFQLRVAKPPKRYAEYFDKIVLAERLREVRGFVGFTRIESPGDSDDPTDIPALRQVPLSRKPPRWIPASEIRGEGIFFHFSEDKIQEWLKRKSLPEHGGVFTEAHRRWRMARGLEPVQDHDRGMRFVLLHSFAHALIRQLAVECGYTAASLRERIYSRAPGSDEPAMAGVLIYTAAPDSEGTLGGLVSLGEPHTLERHLDQALDAMRLCASDPLCAEHHPYRDGTTLHGASCHACLFAPETSCERGNKYLDRTVLVPTVDQEKLAFFDVSGETIDEESSGNDVAENSSGSMEDAASGQLNLYVDLTSEQLRGIQLGLSPAFQLLPVLFRKLEEQEERLFRLTQDQIRLLDFLNAHHRAAIKGVAGSGKTLLASVQAQKFARQGKKTLLVCFNKPLAEWLRQSLAEEFRDLITIRHFHGLCSDYCRKAHVSFSPTKDSAFWRATAPDLFMQALDRLPDDRFDAVVVDEGQDFHPDWWIPMEIINRGGESGPFFVFFDPAQNLFMDDDLAIPDLGTPYELPINCRNTKQIASTCSGIRGVKIPVRDDAPDGIETKVEVVSDSTQRMHKIRQYVDEWFGQGKLKLSQIAILSPFEQGKSCLANADRIGKVNLTTDLDQWRANDGVLFSTIRSFKGLEADAIVLTDVPNPASDAYFSTADLYVACSRAKHLLVILATEKCVVTVGKTK